ncbi:MAG: DUF4333 domain-containing protein [Spirulinaceae cyanobacterium]
MKLLPLRWVCLLGLGLGLTLASCGGAEEAAEEPAAETDTEVVAEDSEAEAEVVAIAPAPEGTFAAGVQEVLMTSFPEQTGNAVESAACPEDAALEATEPFECQVLTSDGHWVAIEVFTDPEAETFDWRTKGLFLVGIEESIEARLLEDAQLAGTADCGSEESPYREEEPGSTFDCTFETEDGDTQTIEVAVQDADGNVVWRLK